MEAQFHTFKTEISHWRSLVYTQKQVDTGFEYISTCFLIFTDKRTIHHLKCIHSIKSFNIYVSTYTSNVLLAIFACTL